LVGKHNKNELDPKKKKKNRGKGAYSIIGPYPADVTVNKPQHSDMLVITPKGT
jgi:hypothetical protein